jgi:cysteine desulfurase family protein (TIGR01976 family)
LPVSHVIDIAAFRARFPALARQHNGHQVAYFDGPGGTQVPQDVVDAMGDYLLHHNANTEWAYPTSNETDAAIALARQALADFVGGDPGEIAFGANMTTLTFHVSRALGRAWGPDDTIVVTELDHHANIDPWLAVAKDRGVRVESVRLDPSTGEIDLDALERALSLRPRLVAVTAASNALGTMPDVASIAARARAAGALVYVDAVHYAPHALVDVSALGCDFLACSAYKFYGPHIGVLWGRKDLLESLDVPKVRPAHDNAPDRIETGTLNHEGIVGAGAVVDFLASFGRATTRRDQLRNAYAGIHARSAALFAMLWDGLGEIGGITRHGPGPLRPRTPTVSFTMERAAPIDVARHLATLGIFVSHGDFYAATVAERLGQRDGFVRVGLSAYSTEQEIERLLHGVASYISRR